MPRLARANWVLVKCYPHSRTQADTAVTITVAEKQPVGDFHGDPVVKNPPVDASETWVWSLDWEDPTCQGGAATTEPDNHNDRSPPWSLCSATREVTARRSLSTTTRKQPPLATAKQSPHSKADPRQPKIGNKFLKPHKEPERGPALSEYLFGNEHVVLPCLLAKHHNSKGAGNAIRPHAQGGRWTRPPHLPKGSPESSEIHILQVRGLGYKRWSEHSP